MAATNFDGYGFVVEAILNIELHVLRVDGFELPSINRNARLAEQLKTFATA
ncbi:MAG: hypothetical protein ACRD5Z_04330 [Bryobacteraceae bacterium]